MHKERDLLGVMQSAGDLLDLDSLPRGKAQDFLMSSQLSLRGHSSFLRYRQNVVHVHTFLGTQTIRGASPIKRVKGTLIFEKFYLQQCPVRFSYLILGTCTRN